MKKVYIASPYTIGDHAANVSVQIQAAHRLLDMKYCPIAPLLSHFLHMYRQRPYEEWLEMGFSLICHCDLLLRLPGESKGANREVQYAITIGIPVVFGWEGFEDWNKKENSHRV